MTACANASTPSPVEPVASGTLLKKGGRSRSKTRSRSRSKARAKSKSRSRSPTQSTSGSIPAKRQTVPDSPTSLQPCKKAPLSKTAPSAAARNHQQPLASQTTNAKTAPREVSWQRAPTQLFPFQPPTHTAPCPPPPPNTNTDPFPEIARLRRDMEERHAQMHAQLDAAIERTNARIQAAIDSARQESLALRQEIITVIHASEERTQALFAELVSRLDSIAPLPNSEAGRSQPQLTGARRSHPYSRPTASSHDNDGAP